MENQLINRTEIITSQEVGIEDFNEGRINYLGYETYGLASKHLRMDFASVHQRVTNEYYGIDSVPILKCEEAFRNYTKVVSDGFRHPSIITEP